MIETYKYDKAMMSTAYVWAEESYCKRNQVGAILSFDGRVVSVGYNGTISGSSNCCEETEAFKSEGELEFYDKSLIEVCATCKGTGILLEFSGTKLNTVLTGRKTCEDCNGFGKVKNKDISKDTVVHAEANAILFAAKNGIPTKNCTLYITLSPCIECAKMIIQSGIKEVIYDAEYRINDGVKFLQKHGISTRKLNLV